VEADLDTVPFRDELPTLPLVETEQGDARPRSISEAPVAATIPSEEAGGAQGSIPEALVAATTAPETSRRWLWIGTLLAVVFAFFGGSAVAHYTVRARTLEQTSAVPATGTREQAPATAAPDPSSASALGQTRTAPAVPETADPPTPSFDATTTAEPGDETPPSSKAAPHHRGTHRRLPAPTEPAPAKRFMPTAI